MPESPSINKAVSLPSPQAPEPDKVRALFERLAHRYDKFNRLASWGLDRKWRKSLLDSLRESDPVPRAILDIGTGTGDLIFDYIKQAGSSGVGPLTGMDLSFSMIRQAKIREAKLSGALKPGFIQASAERVPLASGSMDAVVSAFTFRNLRKIMGGTLGEILRVLKPGGRIFVLEMFVPQNRLVRFFHEIYLKTALPLIGKAVMGRNWPVDYLPDTILNYWTPEGFSGVLQKEGFKNIDFKRLSCGIAVLHSATK